MWPSCSGGDSIDCGSVHFRHCRGWHIHPSWRRRQYWFVVVFYHTSSSVLVLGRYACLRWCVVKTACTQTHTSTHTQTDTHTSTQSCTHTDTHTHTHTHTSTQSLAVNLISSVFLLNLLSVKCNFNRLSNHFGFCLSVCVSVHRSVVERLRPQFFTDFHQILYAAQKCGCFERYCFWDKPEVAYRF